MDVKPPEIPKHGTCEMCGKPDQSLWMLYIGDYVGWTCSECIEQVSKSQQRRYMPAGEHTEPGE